MPMDTTLSDLAQLSRVLARSGPRKVAKLESILSAMPTLSNDDKCVDIGTAHGGLTSYYARHGSWTFIDKNGSNLKVAEVHLKGNFRGNILAEDYLGENGDQALVCGIDTLIYIDKYLELLSVINRSLKDGGYFLVAGGTLPDTWLTRLRRRIGAENAIGFTTYPDAPSMRKSLESKGFEVVVEKHYCGFFSMALQTILDFLIRDDKTVGDQLTLQMASLTREKKNRMLLLSKPLRAASLATNWLDKCTPFFKRYAWVILARKKRTI